MVKFNDPAVGWILAAISLGMLAWCCLKLWDFFHRPAKPFKPTPEESKAIRKDLEDL